MGHGASSLRSKPLQSRAQAGGQPPHKNAKDVKATQVGKDAKAVQVGGSLDQPRTSFTARPPDPTTPEAPAVSERKAQALPVASAPQFTLDRVRGGIADILAQPDSGRSRESRVYGMVLGLMEAHEDRSEAWRAEAARRGVGPADALGAILEAVLGCDNARYADAAGMVRSLTLPWRWGGDFCERHGMSHVALHLPLITRMVERVCEPVEPMALARLCKESKSTPASAPRFADHPAQLESMALLESIQTVLQHDHGGGFGGYGHEYETWVARPLAAAVRQRSPSTLRPLVATVLSQCRPDTDSDSAADHARHLTQFMAGLVDPSLSQRYAVLCGFCAPDPLHSLLQEDPDQIGMWRAQLLLHDVQPTTPPEDLALFMHALVAAQTFQKAKRPDAVLLVCVAELLERHASLSAEQLLCGALGVVQAVGLDSGAQARLEGLRLAANAHAQRPLSTGQAAFARAYELAADPLALSCALDFDATQRRVLLVLGCVAPGLWDPEGMNAAIERIVASHLMIEQKADLCRELVRGHLHDLSPRSLELVHASLLSLSDPEALLTSNAEPASVTLLDFYRECDEALGIAALRRKALSSFTPEAVELARPAIDQAERVLRLLLKQLGTAMPPGQEALRDTLRKHLLGSLDLLGDVLACADTAVDGRERKGSPSRVSSTSLPTSTSTSTASSYTTSSSVTEPDPSEPPSPSA